LNDDLDAAGHGSFTNTNLSDSFPDNWLKKPYTWPVAPVDLRFDRKRGVWTVPPSFRLVTAQLTSTLAAFGSAPATITDGETIYDELGDAVVDKHITVYDKVGNPLRAGDYVIGYF